MTDEANAPMIIPPAAASVLRQLGNAAMGDFMPKGTLTYTGSLLKCVAGYAILAALCYQWFKTGAMPDDSVIAAVVATYGIGSGFSSAGIRRAMGS